MSQSELKLRKLAEFGYIILVNKAVLYQRHDYISAENSTLFPDALDKAIIKTPDDFAVPIITFSQHDREQMSLIKNASRIYVPLVFISTKSIQTISYFITLRSFA